MNDWRLLSQQIEVIRTAIHSIEHVSTQMILLGERIEALEQAVREAPCPRHREEDCPENCCECEVSTDDCDCWKKDILE